MPSPFTTRCSGFRAVALILFIVASSTTLAHVIAGSSLLPSDAHAGTANPATPPNPPPGGPSQVRQGQPAWGAANGVQSAASRPTNAAQIAPKPPPARDCKKLYANPNPDYVHNYHNGAMNVPGPDPNSEHGNIISETKVTTNNLESDLNDLQVRIAQMGCEQANMTDRIDYLIRMLAP
jgi:hypothetical protein